MDKSQAAGAASAMYNPAMAREFFALAGTAEQLASGTTLFKETEKGGSFFRRDKMYLLMEGEVSLLRNGVVVGAVKPGEIFGEMAVISQAPRSATAVAKSACRVITMDRKQFRAALQKKPEFGLMLMSVMIARLRETVARMSANNALPSAGAETESAVFERGVLAGLRRELGDGSILRYEQNKVIVREGQPGVLMYVVLEGVVAVAIGDNIVARIGPGGVFGEMALVERLPRMGTAIAETACSLLGINRNAFLSLMQTRPGFGASLLGAVGERASTMSARQR